MTDKDPEDWLRALSGKGQPDNDASAETRALRNAIKERERHAGRDDRRGLDTLVARLEREGLLAPQERPARRLWLPMGAAASLVGVAVMVGVLMQPDDEPESMRFRGMGEWVEIHAADPATWAQHTRDRLAEAGCSVTLAENPDEEPRVLVVDADEACLRHLNEALPRTASQVDTAGRYRLFVTSSGEES